MVYGQKKRIIDVIQCSGEDMNLVLTNGIPTGIPNHVNGLSSLNGLNALNGLNGLSALPNGIQNFIPTVSIAQPTPATNLIPRSLLSPGMYMYHCRKLSGMFLMFISI